MADFRSKPSWRTPASERAAIESFSTLALRAVFGRERAFSGESAVRLTEERVESLEEEFCSLLFAVLSEESVDVDPIAKAAMATNAQTRWTRYDFFMGNGERSAIKR